MASLQELIALNRDGDVGYLLERVFNGQRGHMQSRRDADLLIGFKSRSETPTAKAIADAVVEHYTKLGYKVAVPATQSENMFDCVIHTGDTGEGFVGLTITTYYALESGDEHNHVRISTIVSA